MTSKIKVNILADGGDNSIITSDGAGSFTASSSLASSVQSVGALQNTPYFYTSNSSDLTPTNNTNVKVPFNTLILGSASDYNTSTYRFTPLTAGKYFIVNQLRFSYSSGYGKLNSAVLFFNGSQDVTSVTEMNYNYDSQVYATVSAIYDFNGSSDYVEAYTYIRQSSSGASVITGSRFYGFKLIGA
jgi:hypothetical protein